MLKKHSQFLVQALFVFDLVLLSLIWPAAYFIRFRADALTRLPGVGKYFVVRHVPPLNDYLYLLIGIVLIWGLVFRFFKIYRPRRAQGVMSECADIFKAFSFAFMVLVFFNYFFARDSFSRGCLALFYALGLVALIGSHMTIRVTLRRLREKGYNLRHVLIVGAGKSAVEVAQMFQAHREMGYRVVGLLTDDKGKVGARVEDFPVIGVYNDVADVANERNLDEIVIALPAEHQGRFYEVLDSLSDELPNIHIVPDLVRAGTLRLSVDIMDGLPFITMRTSPIFGWGGVAKRLFDVAVSIVSLVLLSWLIAFIAVLVKLTSRGPVFYAQDRMGLDGRTFRMLKFRSMRCDAEADGNAGWTKENDPRRTLIGRCLRRTSLDELPQLFNVLKGEMSIVGPRPERPVFVQQFRGSVPKYMLRHKIKAGMTGWAQVNGWRGDTSIKERIAHDLYYIEHWSLRFDLRIMWLTIWRGFVNRRAY